MYRIILSALIISLYASAAFCACPAPNGNIYTPISNSASDIQDCIDDAETHGSDAIVQLNSGTASWTSQLTASCSTNSIHIKGYAETVENAITFGYTGNSDIDVILSAGKTFQISDIYFNATSADAEYLIKMSGSADIDAFWVHDLTFVNTNGVGLFRIYGDNWGALNDLTVSGNVSNIVNIVGSGATAWQTDGGRGTAKAVFLEDSDITFSNYNAGALVIDCQGGGRYVIRYNNIQNQCIGNHGADTGQGDGKHSGMLSEIYHNDFTYTNASSTWNIGYIRGGQVFFHDNTFAYGAGVLQAGVWGSANDFVLTVYRYSGWDHSQYASWNYPCDNSPNQLYFCSELNSDWTGTMTDAISDVDCTGTKKWKLCSGSDGNGSMTLCDDDGDCSGVGGTCIHFVDGKTTGYGEPCFEQPGMGQNNRPSPAYEWNNTTTGADCSSPPCNVGFSSGYIVTSSYYYEDTEAPGSDYTYPHPLRNYKRPVSVGTGAPANISSTGTSVQVTAQ